MFVASERAPIAVFVRWVLRVLAVLLIAAVQIGLVLAAAVVAETPTVAIAVALAASVVLVLGWTWLRSRKRRDVRRRFALAGIVLGMATIMTVLVTLPSAPGTLTASPGALELDDGTFLAMRTIAARAPHRRPSPSWPCTGARACRGPPTRSGSSNASRPTATS